MYHIISYHISYRVAGVGKLSASAKNAFNSFVGRIFANLRQKNVVFARIYIDKEIILEL